MFTTMMTKGAFFFSSFLKCSSLHLTFLFFFLSLSSDSHVLAIVVPHDDDHKEENGKLLFFNAESGTLLNSLDVGALPDMVKFSPNGRYCLVANEGEPNSITGVDPFGTVTIVAISDGGSNIGTLTDTEVDTLDFDDVSLPSGMFKISPTATLGQDLEPEWISFSSNSETAYISLQENNGYAIIDLDERTISGLRAFPVIDRSLVPFDASDKDDGIFIRLWPGIYSMAQPDTIRYFRQDGTDYLLTANEGDTKDWEYFSELQRIKDLDTLDFDPTVFNASYLAVLQEDAGAGRLRITSSNGKNADGKYSRLYSFGGRGMSVIKASTGEVIWDTGDELETFFASQYALYFNSDEENSSFDSRSDDKGSEPEGLALGTLDGRAYAFLILERIGGVVAYISVM